MTPKQGQPAWLTRGYQHIWMPYSQMQTAPLPEACVSTEGSRIKLADGRELIDGCASWWAACHGYNHPHIREKMAEQLEVMPHVMLAGLANQPALTLATRLAELAPGDLNRVFFSESGSVAVELALKIAVQYWYNQGETRRTKFICFRGGYHGDTFATMSLCDPEDGFHAAFSGVVPPQIIADLPTSGAAEDALENILKQQASECAAVIIEPLVQGAGGMLFHDPAVLTRLRRLCDKYGLLLIFDEIFVGLGRLGTMFACQQADVVPDIMTLSKTLTGGTIPLAATMATDRVFKVFLSDKLETCLMHGPTFTGNALACAAANASLDLFENEPRLEQVRRIEMHLARALEPCRQIAGVEDVRARGAIGVVQLDIRAFEELQWLRNKFVEAGCWIRPFGNIAYLTPAYNMAEEDLTHLTDSICQVLPEWAAQFGR